MGYSAIRAFFAAVFASLNPKTTDDAWLVNEQLNLLRHSTRWFAYFLPLAGASLGLIISSAIPRMQLAVWWVALATVCVTGEWIARLIDAATQVDDIASVRHRARVYTVIALVVTVVWGSVGLWGWLPQSAELTMFVRLVLIATLCTLCVFAAVHPGSGLLPILFIGIINGARPYFIPVKLNPNLAHMSVVYGFIMGALAISVYLKTVRTLRLEQERGRLITSLRAAKLESDEAREKAVAASMAKSEFLANMSHDLRTPLNAIIGFSDIIKTKAFGASGEKYSEYGAYIHQSGNHLLGLITNLLELAKIEAGRKILHEEPVDIGSLVSDSVREADEAADKAKIDCTLGHNLPLLQGDVRALRQILDNVIANAVRAAPEGRVHVHAWLSDAGEMSVRVSDNGKGVAPEDQPHFFDRFGRARHDIAHNGAGLGLPIIKGLVELHGGRVTLESKTGEGARITIVFPARRTLRIKDQRVA